MIQAIAIPTLSLLMLCSLLSHQGWQLALKMYSIFLGHYVSHSHKNPSDLRQLESNLHKIIPLLMSLPETLSDNLISSSTKWSLKFGTARQVFILNLRGTRDVIRRQCPPYTCFRMIANHHCLDLKDKRY